MSITTLFPFVSVMADHEPLILDTHMPGKCNICGQAEGFIVKQDNHREGVNCISCNSIPRKRQITEVFLNAYSQSTGIQKPDALTELPKTKMPAGILVAETNSSFADHINTHCTNVTLAEYLGSDKESGEIINGVRHEDLQKTSFTDESLQYIFTSDVFEHIPDPYQAHEEIFRILVKGGEHIFSVPYHSSLAQDDVRARIEDDNKLVHYQPEIYHLDPLSTDGILVYTIFGLEMLVKLERIGFQCEVYHINQPKLGILPKGSIIFKTKKIN